jgi:hypothetical protein
MAGTAFLGAFETNPHCTQRVSFGSAVFATEHHPEDKGWDGPPLVYQIPFAWLIRGMLGGVILASLFWPAIVVMTSREGLEKHRPRVMVQVGVAVSPAVLSLLPREVIGERFQELLRATSLCAAVLVPISLLATIRIRRWRARAQVALEATIRRLQGDRMGPAPREQGPWDSRV